MQNQIDTICPFCYNQVDFALGIHTCNNIVDGKQHIISLKKYDDTFLSEDFEVDFSQFRIIYCKFFNSLAIEIHYFNLFKDNKFVCQKRINLFENKLDQSLQNYIVELLLFL